MKKIIIILIITVLFSVVFAEEVNSDTFLHGVGSMLISLAVYRITGSPVLGFFCSMGAGFTWDYIQINTDLVSGGFCVSDMAANFLGASLGTVIAQNEIDYNNKLWDQYKQLYSQKERTEHENELMWNLYLKLYGNPETNIGSSGSAINPGTNIINLKKGDNNE
jgi:hypothetical protein